MNNIIIKNNLNKPTSTGCEPNVGSLNQMKGANRMKETLDLSKLEIKEEKYKPMTEWQAIQEEEERQEQFFINEEERRQNANGYTLYIKEDPRKGVFDNELYTDLYKFCIKAIKLRLVMLLDLENLISSLINIEEYTYGFQENPTTTQMESLKRYKESLLSKLNNKKVKDFIKNNNDYIVFGTDESTKSDYITTYQRILKLLSKSSTENLEIMKDIINNIKDSLQQVILDNDYEPEYTSFKENEDIEEAEDLVLAY